MIGYAIYHQSETGEVMIREFDVYYQVSYKCKITIDSPKGVVDRKGLTAAISDIEIPEGGYERSEYIDRSFKVLETREIKNDKEKT